MYAGNEFRTHPIKRTSLLELLVPLYQDVDGPQLGRDPLCDYRSPVCVRSVAELDGTRQLLARR